MSVGGVTRAEVLTLYRRILRLAQSWEARIPTAQVIEREYIQKEAKTRFRENKTVSDPKLINELFHEAEARIEIGKSYSVHYGDLILISRFIFHSTSLQKSVS